MKKLFLSIFSFIRLLAISGCAKDSNPRVLKNGDLLAIGELTYEHAFRDVSANDMEILLKSNETFVFYLTSSECHSCYEFQEKIMNYVSSNNALVYRMDLYEQKDEFNKFAEKYHDYFFYDNSIATPQVYIAKGEAVATKVPYSRYSTSTMFKNAMKDYINQSNVYSFKSSSAYNKYILDKEEYMTIVIDRSNASVMNLYNSEISEIIKRSKKDVFLFEISEGDNLGLELTSPVGFYHSKSEDIQYIFSDNQSENKTFLNKYC